MRVQKHYTFSIVANRNLRVEYICIYMYIYILASFLKKKQVPLNLTPPPKKERKITLCVMEMDGLPPLQPHH